MNTFKENYRDVLLTLNKYIKSDDLAGLRNYYSSTIIATSEEISKNTFVFQYLDKIKVPEIKSIFIAKLMLAQNLHIHTSFTTNAEITNIPMDSISLVRMLGIILDNAIEAQQNAPQRLDIGCFKSKEGIYFIIENPCPQEMPPFHKLWEKNFTTKDGNRGLGLSNLLEIVGQIPNVTLETDIIKNNFIQKIFITNIERD
jgi:two-component system sensor histidine kinase AgrC